MSDAETIKAEVGAQLFELNAVITTLSIAKASMHDIGTKVFALRTHNVDAMHAAGILVNEVPEMLEEMMKRVQLAVRNLESFQAGV
jgi:metal-dependent HD superfamily phosphatase/phosphodiesterase